MPQRATVLQTAAVPHSAYRPVSSGDGGTRTPTATWAGRISNPLRYRYATSPERRRRDLNPQGRLAQRLSRPRPAPNGSASLCAVEELNLSLRIKSPLPYR